MIDFCHLHVHSEFSLLDGLNSVKLMAERAKELNQKAIAITDHAQLGGEVDYYRECRKNDI
jgi:DNA polymerase-3 subunit alpha